MELCEKAAPKPDAAAGVAATAVAATTAAAATTPVAAAGEGAELTCCVIKPHALQQTGTVLRELSSSGLSIRNMQCFRLTSVAAREFLEIYDTVLKEFPEVRRKLKTSRIFHYNQGTNGPAKSNLLLLLFCPLLLLLLVLLLLLLLLRVAHLAADGGRDDKRNCSGYTAGGARRSRSP